MITFKEHLKILDECSCDLEVTDDCGCDDKELDECSCGDNEEVDVFEDTDGSQYYIELDEETLLERRIKIRVNSKGKRTKRIVCGKGRILKTVNGRKVCVNQQGRARIQKKLAIRKANRTKKAKGAGYKRRTNFKRQRAIKRRKNMGLRNGQ